MDAPTESVYRIEAGLRENRMDVCKYVKCDDEVVLLLGLDDFSYRFVIISS